LCCLQLIKIANSLARLTERRKPIQPGSPTPARCVSAQPRFPPLPKARRLRESSPDLGNRFRVYLSRGARTRERLYQPRSGLGRRSPARRFGVAAEWQQRTDRELGASERGPMFISWAVTSYQSNGAACDFSQGIPFCLIEIPYPIRSGFELQADNPSAPSRAILTPVTPLRPAAVSAPSTPFSSAASFHYILAGAVSFRLILPSFRVVIPPFTPFPEAHPASCRRFAREIRLSFVGANRYRALSIIRLSPGSKLIGGADDCSAANRFSECAERVRCRVFARSPERSVRSFEFGILERFDVEFG